METNATFRRIAEYELMFANLPWCKRPQIRLEWAWIPDDFDIGHMRRQEVPGDSVSRDSN